MPSNLMTGKSTLLAMALSLSALGSTTLPAAAFPDRIFMGNAPIAIPHFGGGIPNRTINSYNDAPHIPVQKPTGNPPGIGAIDNKTAEVPVPTGNPAGTRVIGSVNTKVEDVPNTQPTGPVAKTISSLGNKVIIPGATQGTTAVQWPKGGIDNVCPDNPFKCPKGNPGGAGGSGTGGGGTGGGGSASNGSTNPNGGGYPIPVPIVVPLPQVTSPTPGVVVQAPAYGGSQQVIGRQPVAAQPVAQAPIATAPNAAPAEPASCLTKQYLTDGSVIFRDLCTNEAAMATPAELRAQAIAAAQAQQPAAR